jgi:hypothetical protein
LLLHTGCKPVHQGAKFPVFTFSDALLLPFGFGQGLLPGPLPPLPFQFQVQGVMVGAAQLAEFAVDLAQAVPLFVRVGLLFHEAEGEAGKLFGQDGGEAVAEGEGAGRLVEGGGAVGHHRPPAPRGGVRGAGGGKFKHQTPKSKEISNTKPQGKSGKRESSYAWLREDWIQHGFVWVGLNHT